MSQGGSDEDCGFFNPELFLNLDYETVKFSYSAYAKSAQQICGDIPHVVPLLSSHLDGGETNQGTEHVVGEEEPNSCDLAIKVSTAASGDHDLTGQLVWPASQALCVFAIAYARLFAGRRVLELGSGVGIGGLMVAKYARQVVLTDGNDIVVDLLRGNGVSCMEDGSVSATVNSHLLQWGERLDEFETYLKDCTVTAEDEDHKFDLICGADITFFQKCLPQMFQTVDRLLRKVSGACFIVAGVTRSHVNDRAVVKVSEEAGFDLFNVPLDNFVRPEDREGFASYNQTHVKVFSRKA